MPLHALVLLAKCSILESELPDLSFKLLGPALDTAAFLVPSMLNTLKLVAGGLGFVPKFHVEILERLDLLLQGVLLRACQGQLRLVRFGIGHCLFILLLTDTADHG